MYVCMYVCMCACVCFEYAVDDSVDESVVHQLEEWHIVGASRGWEHTMCVFVCVCMTDNVYVCVHGCVCAWLCACMAE